MLGLRERRVLVRALFRALGSRRSRLACGPRLRYGGSGRLEEPLRQPEELLVLVLVFGLFSIATRFIRGWLDGEWRA